MASTDFLARLGESSARVGFELASIDPALIERLATLDACSPVLEDAERISAWAFALFRYYELNKPDQAFDVEERRVVILASLFSDIGKTGPLRANPAQQTQIAQMFAVEGVKNDAQTVKSFVRRLLPSERRGAFVGAGEVRNRSRNVDSHVLELSQSVDAGDSAGGGAAF